jgi:23S rRNA pseudouridine1911/1915/1917 synthase
VTELPATIELGRDHAGRVVDELLVRALPGGATASFVAKLLRQGRVLLAGRALEAGERLPGRGRLEVLPPLAGQGPRPPAPNPRVQVVVRHADEHILVIDKPAGLTMHPGPGHGSDTLLNGLVGPHPELLELGAERGFGLVHRLDRETSGVLVVARTPAAYDALVAAFGAREVEKRYRALTKGAPREPRGVIETPVDEREARSSWELVDRVGARRWVVAQVALHPHTGRKHQLRVHMAAVGCPILGDKRHGPETMPIAQQLGLRRVALHAESLALRHPVTGERLAFESAWPADLEAIWQRARQVAASL